MHWLSATSLSDTPPARAGIHHLRVPTHRRGRASSCQVSAVLTRLPPTMTFFDETFSLTFNVAELVAMLFT
jgi:hypothetical protein